MLELQQSFLVFCLCRDREKLKKMIFKIIFWFVVTKNNLITMSSSLILDEIAILKEENAELKKELKERGQLCPKCDSLHNYTLELSGMGEYILRFDNCYYCLKCGRKFCESCSKTMPPSDTVGCLESCESCTKTMPPSDTVGCLESCESCTKTMPPSDTEGCLESCESCTKTMPPSETEGCLESCESCTKTNSH